MGRYVKIAVIGAVVMALVGVSVAVVAAQDPQEETVKGPFGWFERLRQAIAEELGISVERYEAAVDAARERLIEETKEEGWSFEEHAEGYRKRFRAGRGPMFFRFEHAFPGTARTVHSLESVAAEELGMTVDELFDELEDSKSIAELAEEKGVDPQAIVDVYVAGIREQLQQVVANEWLTQTQADAILKRITEQALKHLEMSGTCRLGPMWMGPEVMPDLELEAMPWPFGPDCDEPGGMPHIKGWVMPRRGMRGFGRGPF
jgi:hypothetical protein